TVQIRRRAFQTVGEFAHDRLAGQPAGLLKIGELRDLHAVEPDLPAQTPGAERGRLPVVFDKADVVYLRIDADDVQQAQIELLEIQRRGFHHDLVLVIVLQAVGVFTIAAVARATAGLQVGGVPRLGADGTQERGRMERAG